MKKIASTAVILGCLTAAATPVMARTNIRIVGSSTVYPFTKAVAERFARANPKIPAPIVESTGTGAGMKLFCAGIGENFPDIEDASRRMKASEAKTCAANGVSQVTEIQVGLDGIALATARNTELAGVSLRDIYLAIAKTPFGKPNTAKTWKDVNGKLPAIPIRVYGPPSTSGTRSSVEDMFMEPICASNPGIAAMKKTNEAKYNAICKGIREDGAYINAGENDNLIVQKLEANPGTIGIFGYSYLEENAARLKGIAINGVAPSYETISSFRYPGARALYVYVKNAHLKAIPGIRQFLAEYVRETTFGPQGYLIRYGLVASPAGVRAQSAQKAAQMPPLNFGTLK